MFSLSDAHRVTDFDSLDDEALGRSDFDAATHEYDETYEQENVGASDNTIEHTPLRESRKRSKYAKGAELRPDGASIMDFSTKSHALGGLNGIFKCKYRIPDLAPNAVLKYSDAIPSSNGNTIVHVPNTFSSMSFEKLNMFDWYMSFGLVVIKPRIMSQSHNRFLIAHRKMLSIESDAPGKASAALMHAMAASPGKVDAEKKPGSKQLGDDTMVKEVFIETDSFIVLPKYYALSLYGPSVMFCRKRVAYSSSGISAESTTSSDVKKTAGSDDGNLMDLLRQNAVVAKKFPIDINDILASGVNVSCDQVDSIFDDLNKRSEHDEDSSKKAFESHKAAVKLERAKKKSGCGTSTTKSNPKKRKRVDDDDDNDDNQVDDQEDEDDLDIQSDKIYKRHHIVRNDIGTPTDSINGQILLPTPIPMIPRDLFGNTPAHIASQLAPPSAFKKKKITSSCSNSGEAKSRSNNNEQVNMFTKPLKFNAKLRRIPIDQLSIIAGIILQWRGLLSFDQQQRLAACMVCLPCGMGKTIIAIAACILATCDSFDAFAGMDLNTCFGLDDDYVSPPPTTTNTPAETSEQTSTPLTKVVVDPILQGHIDAVKAAASGLAPARRTLKPAFLVHGKDLLQQTAERISDFVPDARVGIIMQSERPVNLDYIDILLISADTLAVQEFPDGYFDAISIVVTDESHQFVADFFLRCIRKLPARFMLSLTATPRAWVLPWFLGPVLVYPKRPYVEQNVEMVVYGCGKQTLRTRRLNGRDSANVQDQAVDICMDMKRNAWLVHLTMDVTVFGKVPTHDETLIYGEKSLLLDKIKRMLFVLSSGGSGSSIVANNNLKLGDARQQQQGLQQQQQQQQQQQHRVTSISMKTMPKNASIHSLLSACDKNTKSAAKPKHAAKLDSMMMVVDTKKDDCSSSSLLRIESHLNLTKLPRIPIFFSENIQHLIMHWHWHAFYWMETCTSVPRQYLRLIRTGVRQLSVVDVRQLDERHSSCIKWLHKSQQFVAHSASFDPSSKPELKRSESFAPPMDSSFWELWFEKFPMNDTVALESGIFKLTKQGGGNNNSFAARRAKLKKNADGSASEVIDHSLMRALQSVPSTMMNGIGGASATMASERAYLRSCMNVNQTVEQVPLAESPGKFDATHWMHHSSFYWTPVYGPLPRSVTVKPESSSEKRNKKKLTKRKQGKDAKMMDIDSGAFDDIIYPSSFFIEQEWHHFDQPSPQSNAGIWKKSMLEDVRPTPTPSRLPGTLATFGLLVGVYKMPKAIGVPLKSLHLREALDSDFVYASYQMASTGTDRPAVDTQIEATPLKDNEQADGRFKRFTPTKQNFLKIEFVEPWSLYTQITRLHNQEYREEERQVQIHHISSSS